MTRIWFVASRFERLKDHLLVNGYALDPGSRDPNQWEELAREDPPLGLVRIKGVRLVDPTDADSAFDEQISFSIEEWWTTDHVADALDEQGYYLAQYSYHAHYHGTDQRWDFDPLRHPDEPYHFHPPGSDVRKPGQPVTPEDALDAFEGWIAAQP